MLLHVCRWKIEKTIVVMTLRVLMSDIFSGCYSFIVWKKQAIVTSCNVLHMHATSKMFKIRKSINNTHVRLFNVFDVECGIYFNREKSCFIHELKWGFQNCKPVNLFLRFRINCCSSFNGPIIMEWSENVHIV